MSAALSLVFALCVAAPGGETRPKQKEALVKARIQEAARYSAEHQGLSLIVWQRGAILLERYDNGATPSDKNRLASIVKSIWAVAVAAAVDKGWLRWDERVADTLTEWQDDPSKTEIELRHLLSMSSGLDPGYAVIDDDQTSDKLSAALPLPALGAPGVSFAYGPANASILGLFLKRKLEAHHLGLMAFLEQAVLGPLQIREADWRSDRAGNPMMAAGAYLSARDLLTLGRMLVEGGKSHARRVLDPERIAPLFEGSAANPMYGLGFWLNRAATTPNALEVDLEAVLGTDFADWSRSCFSRRAPEDLAVMLGSWNQRVYLSPSLGLVVVRQGKGTDFKDAEFLGALFGG